MKREEYLRLIRNNESIKTILDSARDEAERKAVRAHVEDILLQMFDNMILPLNDQIEKDPEGMAKAWREIEKELITKEKKTT
jgi:hypothetical protein